MIERTRMGEVAPHHWDQCFPVIIEKGKPFNKNDERNRAIRRIFRKLRVDERIKFHQATCQERISPAHDAVIAKIQAKLAAEGLL